jgi:hypothetical protein
MSIDQASSPAKRDGLAGAPVEVSIDIAMLDTRRPLVDEPPPLDWSLEDWPTDLL